MKFDFDANGRYEYPVIVLANPNFEELSLMEQLKSLKITPRFSTVSEADFLVYQEYNNTILPYYEDILKNKLVHIIGFGWWVIDNVIETNDGGVTLKEVHCLSYEYTINYKGINLLNGTYKFYDIINPENTLLYKLMSVLPNWKIGSVDISLNNLYRTFDIPDGTLYGFMMNEVSNTYEVIFEFDTENLLINAYNPKNIVKNTDIILSFDNVNKNIKVSELSTDIYTVLRVNGADNLSISMFNPLGDDRLYNLGYYKNSKWINDQSLINKITAWENLVELQRVPYANLLALLKDRNRELLKLQTELRDLQSELNALEIVRKNLTDQPDQFKIQTNKIDAKNLEINNKKKEIKSKELQINDIKDRLKSINDKVRYDNYFTVEEKKALDPYILESVYTDENFIVTDEMRTPANANGDTLVITTTGTKKIKDLTPADIIIDEQYIANQLLEHGRSVLESISKPSFTFELDSTNFLFIEKFLPFIKQINLGSLINVEIKEGDWAYPVLLEISLDYDNPTSFSMTFGNRFRLSSAEWTFAELHNEQAKVSAQVGSTLNVAAEPVLNGSINNMSNYMVNNIIAANQEIQSTVDNEVSIGGYGLRCKKKDDSYASGYDPHQLWLNNNLICMSDDNWQSVKLAIGYIGTSQNPNSKYYAVNAEVVAGNLLAGNQLVIQDGVKGQETTFIVDTNGCRLTNASFVLTTKDNKGKIILNPSNGIHIQTNKTGTLKDVFYVDNQGYLMATDITATGGTIGGFNIKPDHFYSTKTINNPNSLSNSKVSNNVPIVDLRTDGTGNIGMLSWNLTNARFDGSIYAKSGTIGGFSISSHSIESANRNILLNDDGTGKISLFTWNQNNAWFNGNIYAKNLQKGDFNSDIIDDKFENSSFPHSKVDGKFDTLVARNIEAMNIFADYAEFKYLKADVAEISEAYIDKLQAKQIISDEINTRNLVSQYGNFSGTLTANITYCNAIQGAIYADSLIWKGEELIKLIQFQDKDGEWHEVLGNY